MKFITLSLVSLPLLAACAASAPSAPMALTDPNPTLPAEVRVPAGNKPVLKLRGSGDLVWSCEFKGPPTDNKYEWAFYQVDAKLLDRDGKQVGRVFGKPAEFDYFAGSVVTGVPVATAAGGDGSLPNELLKANPAVGNHDAFKGTTYIQRVATQGGPVPTDGCTWLNYRQGRKVKYEADYIFYRAG